MNTLMVWAIVIGTAVGCGIAWYLHYTDRPPCPPPDPRDTVIDWDRYRNHEEDL